MTTQLWSSSEKDNPHHDDRLGIPDTFVYFQGESMPTEAEFALWITHKTQQALGASIEGLIWGDGVMIRSIRRHPQSASSQPGQLEPAGHC